MKAVLRYRRLPKPRGDWRYPLWVRIGIEGPDKPWLAWETPQFALGRCEPQAATDSPRIRRTTREYPPAQVRLLTTSQHDIYSIVVCPGRHVETVMYWLTKELRERFIAHLDDVVFPSMSKWVDAHKSQT